jgi:hypothetical protein
MIKVSIQPYVFCLLSLLIVLSCASSQADEDRAEALRKLSNQLGWQKAQLYAVGKEIPMPPAPPAWDNLSAAGVRDAARASLMCASEYLFSNMGTNQMKLVVMPNRSVVGYGGKKVEVRYSKKMVEQPVFKDKYETYETFEMREGATSLDPMRRVKVKRRRLVSREKVGTKMVEQLVRDPNGSIVKTHDSEAIHGYYLQHGVLGMNAMALLALYEAGVPESDERLQTLTEQIGLLITDYGLPDSTWDLAWLSAAFAYVQNDDFEEPVFKAALNKLLDGQITYGKARGMWGPICINMELLAAAMNVEAGLAVQLAAEKKKLAERPDSDSQQATVDEMESLQAAVFDMYEMISRHGHRYNSAIGGLKFSMQNSIDYLDTTATGLPFLIYEQSAADLDSTALAVYAIHKVLERRGDLPDETIHPSNPVPGRGQRMSRLRLSNREGPPLLPGERTSAIMARAANALATIQGRDGTWSEALVHELGVVPLVGAAAEVKSMPPETLLQVESRTTPLSTALGYNVMERIGQIVGMSKFLSKFQRNLSAGYQAVQKDVERCFTAPPSQVVPERGTTQPSQYWFALGRAHLSPTTGNETRRDVWSRLAWQAVMHQEKDGSWGGGLTTPLSPIAFELVHRRVKAVYDAKMAKQPADKRQPFPWTRQHMTTYRVDARILSTCYAMLFLSEGVRPPQAGYLAKTPFDNPSLLVGKAVEFYGRKRGYDQAPLRLATICKDSLSSASLCPVIIGSSADFGSPELLPALREAAARGATMVVEIAPDADISEAETALTALIPDGKVAAIPATEKFLEQYPSPQRPSLKGVVRADGGVAAVLLPWSPKGPQGGAGRLSPMEAVGAVVAVLKHEGTAAGVGMRTYPFQLEDAEDPFVAHARTAASMLRAAVPVAPVVPKAPAKAAAEGGAASPAPAPVPAEPASPAADEVW